MPLPAESHFQPPPGRWAGALAMLLVLASTVFTIAGALWYESARDRGVRVVEVQLRAPENGNYYPREIRAAPGERIRLKLRNVDAVGHGFTLPDLDVGVVEIKPGEVVVLDLTVPDRAGEHAFFCTVWCSADHMRMRGRLVITPVQARR